MVARPFSTRALENVIEHIALFPEDISRVRSVIKRYYPYDEEVEKQVQITNVETVLDSHALLKTDSGVTFTEADKAGPVYAKDKKGNPVLKFKDIEIPVRPDAPKSMDEIPWDRRMDWTPTNLRYLYDILQDFKSGNHMIFTGHAGTGKDVIAAYLSMLIFGKSVEVFSVTNNALVEDIIAYLGLGEGEKVDANDSIVAVGKNETGIVPAYVIRAMRAGRPLILSEINKAKPEVLAALNNILQFGWIELANGKKVYAQPGFCIIGTMNPSSDSRYIGNFRLSGEFMARFSTHRFADIPEAEEIEMLKKFNERIRTQDEDGAAFGIIKEELIKRLVKMVGKIRSGKFSHPVSMRALKHLIVEIAEYPESYSNDLENLLREKIFFFDETEQDKVIQAAIDEDVGKYQGSGANKKLVPTMTEIIEYTIDTGSPELDTLMQNFKDAGNDPLKVLEAILGIDGFLQANKSAKAAKALFPKAAEVFTHLQSGKSLTGGSKKEISEVVARFMTYVSSRLSDSAKSKPLPAFEVIVPMKGDWDLAASTQLGRKTIGEKICGILRVAGQKEAAAFLEFDGQTYLTIPAGVEDGKILKSIDEVHGNILIGESKGLDHATAKIFADYVVALSNIREQASKIASSDKSAEDKAVALAYNESKEPQNKKLGLTQLMLQGCASLWIFNQAPVLESGKRVRLKTLLGTLKLEDAPTRALYHAVQLVDPKMTGNMPEAWVALAKRSESRSDDRAGNGERLTANGLRSTFLVPRSPGVVVRSESRSKIVVQGVIKSALVDAGLAAMETLSSDVHKRFVDATNFLDVGPQCYRVEGLDRAAAVASAPEGAEIYRFFAMDDSLGAAIEGLDPQVAKDIVTVLMLKEAADFYARGAKAMDTLTENKKAEEAGYSLAGQFVAELDNERREALKKTWRKFEKQLPAATWESVEASARRTNLANERKSKSRMRADVKAAKQEAEELTRHPEVDAFIFALNDDDSGVRNEALAALKASSSKKASYFLLAYENKAPEAANVAGALEFAKEGIRHANDAIKNSSIKVLGILKDASAVAPLVEIAPKTYDYGRRTNIAQSLGKIGDVAAIPALIDTLQYLLRGNYTGREDNETPYKELQKAVLEALMLLGAGEQASELLIADANDLLAIDPRHRKDRAWGVSYVMTADGLGLLNAAGASEVLRKGLSQNFDTPIYKTVRIAAVNGLRAIGDRGAVDSLTLQMGIETAADVLQAIAGILSEFANPTATEAMIKLLADTKRAPYAVQVLEAIGTDEANFWVCLFKGNIDEAKSVSGWEQWVTDAVSHSHSGIRSSAIKTVVSAGRVETYLTPFILKLNDDDPGVRNEALAALKASSSKKASYFLLAYENKAPEAANVAGALEFAKEGIRHANDAIKNSSIKVLGILKDASAVAPLVEIAPKTYDYGRRTNIAQSLGKIGDVAAIPALIDTLQYLLRGNYTGREDNETPYKELQKAVLEALMLLGAGEQASELLIADANDLLAIDPRHRKDRAWGVSYVMTADGLGLLNAAGASEVLRKGLSQNFDTPIYKTVRIAAVNGLRAIGDRGAVDSLTLQMGIETAADVLQAIAGILSEFANPTATEAMIKLLSDAKRAPYAVQVLEAIRTDEANFWVYLYEGKIEEIKASPGLRGKWVVLARQAMRHPSGVIRANAVKLLNPAAATTPRSEYRAANGLRSTFTVPRSPGVFRSESRIVVQGVINPDFVSAGLAAMKTLSVDVHKRFVAATNFLPAGPQCYRVEGLGRAAAVASAMVGADTYVFFAMDESLGTSLKKLDVQVAKDIVTVLMVKEAADLHAREGATDTLTENKEAEEAGYAFAGTFVASLNAKRRQALKTNSIQEGVFSETEWQTLEANALQSVQNARTVNAQNRANAALLAEKAATEKTIERLFLMLGDPQLTDPKRLGNYELLARAVLQELASSKVAPSILFDRLMKAVFEPNFSHRDQAIAVLRMAGTDKARFFVLVYHGGPVQDAAQVPGAAEYAKELLTWNKDTFFRLTAAMVLALLKDADSKDAILKSFQELLSRVKDLYTSDEDGDTKLPSYEFLGTSLAQDLKKLTALLGEWKDKSVETSLAKGLRSPLLYVRWWSAQALAASGAKDRLQEIINASSGEIDPWPDLLEAVLLLTDESSLKIAQAAWASKNWAKAALGRAMLEKIGTPEARALIKPSSTSRAEAREQQSSTRNAPRATAELSTLSVAAAGRAESRTVTFNIFHGIFSLADVRQFGATFLDGLLRLDLPELFASETRQDIAYTTVLTHSATALSQPVKVVRIYESLPEVTGPEMQVLADLMAKNHGVQLLLLVRTIDALTESKFRKDMTEEIHRRRKTASDGFKGVNLRVTASGEAVAAFLEGEQMRGLVYGDQGAQDLDRVVSHVRGRKLRNVLMVRKDPVQGDPTLMPAAELLAAFERLYTPGELPEDVVSTGSLLAQYVQLQAAAEQLIRKSA